MKYRQLTEVGDLDLSHWREASRLLAASWRQGRPTELHLPVAQAESQLRTVARGRSRWVRLIQDRALLVVDVKTAPKSSIVRASVHAETSCPPGVLQELAETAVSVAQQDGARSLQLTYPSGLTDASCLRDLQFHARSATIEAVKVLVRSNPLPDSRGVEWLAFSTTYPAAYLEACCGLKAELALTARGDRQTDVSNIAPARLEADAAAARAACTPIWGVLAISPDGQVIGLCDFMLNTPNAGCAMHVDTVIARAERCRGLGADLKRRTLSMLAASFPKVRQVWTRNNELNLAIRALNRSLGYHEVLRMPWVERCFSQGED